MTDGVGRAEGGDRGRSVEALAHVPRPAHLLGLGLEVAAGHVEADPVAEDVLQRGLHGDVGPTARQRDDELDLVVEVIGGDGEGEAAAVRHDGGGGLHEEEGRLAIGVVAHLDRVIGVVATDAEHARHREDGVGAVDRQRHRRRRWNRVVGHRLVA